MFEIFSQEMDVTIVMLFLFAVSVLCKLIPGIWYRHLIREVDNMAGTNSMLLKQCKLKFSNCYQLNGRVANIGIFVDKFISRLKVGPFSFDGVDHFSRQALVLSVFAGGVGVCRSLIKGCSLFEILPFYVACFAAIYLYYTVSGMVSIKNLKTLLRVNLIDYLENHLSSRLLKTNRDLRELCEEEVPVRKKPANVPLTQLPKKDPEPVREAKEVVKKESELVKESTKGIAKNEAEPVKEAKDVEKKELAPIKEPEAIKVSEKAESVAHKESPVIELAERTAPTETKKKTATKRTTKQAVVAEKAEANNPEQNSATILKAEQKTLESTPPPRSIDPEEIRKVLQELLGYSQA